MYLPVNQLAFYDIQLDLVLEPGRIFIFVGNSNEDTQKIGQFEITGEGKILVKERIFVCPVEINKEK